MTSRGLFRADVLLAQSRTVGPVLGLETGGPQASLALASRGSLLAMALPARKAHGEAVVGAIDQLMLQAGLTIKQLIAIAVGIGPGSFTGLRIALSYAKGVALATGCGVVGVPSLDGLALCALTLPGLALEVTICPILDAGRGEVYAALYRRVENGLEKLSGEFLAKPQDLARQIQGEAVYLGQGAIKNGDALRDGASGRRMLIAEEGVTQATAGVIAALGAARVGLGEVDAVGSLQPLYVRPSEAELKKKHAAGTAGLEALWSTERKNLSASTATTTKS
jgi:tRNA threonylcarbamoyladenosine biosynthesis protein TsaB